MQQVGPQDLRKPESRRDFLRTVTRRKGTPTGEPTARASAAVPDEVAKAKVPPLAPWTDARMRLVRRATYGPRAASPD